METCVSGETVDSSGTFKQKLLAQIRKVIEEETLKKLKSLNAGIAKQELDMSAPSKAL